MEFRSCAWFDLEFSLDSCVIGGLVKYYHYGARGAEIIPNYIIWKELKVIYHMPCGNRFKCLTTYDKSCIHKYQHTNFDGVIVQTRHTPSAIPSLVGIL